MGGARWRGLRAPAGPTPAEPQPLGAQVRAPTPWAGAWNGPARRRPAPAAAERGCLPPAVRPSGDGPGPPRPTQAWPRRPVPARAASPERQPRALPGAPAASLRLRAAPVLPRSPPAPRSAPRGGEGHAAAQVDPSRRPLRPGGVGRRGGVVAGPAADDLAPPGAAWRNPLAPGCRRPGVAAVWRGRPAACAGRLAGLPGRGDWPLAARMGTARARRRPPARRTALKDKTAVPRRTAGAYAGPACPARPERIRRPRPGFRLLLRLAC